MVKGFWVCKRLQLCGARVAGNPYRILFDCFSPQRAKLKRQTHKEFKGAVRELRKDNQFLEAERAVTLKKQRAVRDERAKVITTALYSLIRESRTHTLCISNLSHTHSEYNLRRVQALASSLLIFPLSFLPTFNFGRPLRLSYRKSNLRRILALARKLLRAASVSNLASEKYCRTKVILNWHAKGDFEWSQITSESPFEKAARGRKRN